jgi:hypothetical protein
MAAPGPAHPRALTLPAKWVSLRAVSSKRSRRKEMVALLVGILLVLFGVYSVLPIDSPGFLDWSREVVQFLKGAAPIMAFLVGLISFFIGIADIKDKIEARKEEMQDKEKTDQKTAT